MRNNKFEREQQKIFEWIKLIIIMIFIIFLVGLGTYRREKIEVETDSPKIYYVIKTWWGLKETRIQIRWMWPPGYDYPAWCARDNQGKWYPYLVDYWGH